VSVESLSPTDADDFERRPVGELTPMTTVYRESALDLVVARREVVAADVVALTLTDPRGEALPVWTPGAHIDLVLGEGLVRQYSLCGVPQDRQSWRIGVLRTPDSQGGSVRVHDTLYEDSTVRVRGPRNHFSLLDAPRYLFIAGGIGITPLLPMVASAERRGAEWSLVYGGRQRTSMAFAEELAGNGDRVQYWPQDEMGVLDLPTILADPRSDTLIYCCGPEGLLSAVEATSAAAGWPPGALHVERFAPKPVEPTAAADASFELVLQASGITTAVPGDRSILEVVEQHGLSVLSSCRIGTCGTCEQHVLAGELEHRDSVLTEEDREAGEYMMICVSRCRSERLVLDL
jgi:ferredoxin-NADP reductase